MSGCTQMDFSALHLKFKSITTVLIKSTKCVHLLSHVLLVRLFTLTFEPVHLSFTLGT